ncbi:DsbE family thiol:disulfide interchange protein [Aurantivibrio plasticivorans]
MKRLKLFIPLIIFVLLAILFTLGLGIDPHKMPSALVGRPVPNFSLSTVQDKTRIVDQEQLKGHGFALINIWATWCGPCRQEHPFLVKLANNGFPIFGVNAKDELELAQQWLKERGDPYKFSAFDPEGRLGLDLGVYGYPETFLINSEGQVLHRFAGVLTEKVWQRDFIPLINP